MSEKYLYNQEQKEEFIKSYQGDSNNTFVRGIFKQTRYDEEYKGKDICEFSEKEILETLKGFNTSSLNSLKVKTSILRTYSKWCERNGYIPNNMNCFENIEESDIVPCINENLKAEKILTYEQLIKYCSELPNAIDQVLLLAFFEGMKTKEIASLKKSDLHESYFDLEDRKFSVSTKLYTTAMEAVNTDTYVAIKGNLQVRKLLDCDYVFKPKINGDTTTIDSDNERRIKRRFLNIKNLFGLTEMTVSSLYYSGLIHHMKKIAQNKGIELLDVIEVPEFEPIKEKYGMKNEPKYTTRGKLKNYI